MQGSKGEDVELFVIQRILRHANVNTTATYYIKTAADDVRSAMSKLENVIPSTAKTFGDARGSNGSLASGHLQDTNHRFHCTLYGELRPLSDWDCGNWRRGRDSNPRYRF